MEFNDKQKSVLDVYTSQKQATIEAEAAKQKTEFSRYKQDCRKRALDLAHGDLDNWWIGKTKGSLPTNDPEPDVEKIADKYYNWLISIPN